MGLALAEASDEAAQVLRAADEALGEPISEFSHNGPEDQLNLTVNAQPAILATSIAYLRALEQQTGRSLVPAFYAGHSMGQYSAMVAAGVISLGDGMRLVRERGKQMQASASDGAMAAVTWSWR
jgi:[acyl-carrier-protein] S-malonyltransferase